MRPDVTHTHQDLLRELEQEKRARQRAVDEAAHQSRFAQSMVQLSVAMAASGDLDDLLRKLVQIFAELAGVDLAVLRIREGERLRSRAAVGLEAEVTARVSLPVAEAFVARAPSEAALLRLPPAARDEMCGKSELLRSKGVRELFCLPLTNGQDLLGAVYLATLDDRELSDADQHCLGVLAARAAAAIVRRTELLSLEQAVSSRDDVLSVVAHDLRNPLAVVSIAANMLLRQDPDPSSRRLIDRIVRGSLRAERLIQDLLEINAIETGRFSVQRQRVEPVRSDLVGARVAAEPGWRDARSSSTPTSHRISRSSRRTRSASSRSWRTWSATR